MLNILAKGLLVSTSLSPVLGAVVVNQIERGESWTSWIWWLVAAFLLVSLCWLLLKYATMRFQRDTLHIKEFERKDQEILTFLFIYLLPFLQSKQSTYANEWLTGVYILTIIILAIAHAGAFHFNPIMRLLFHYRFYAVKDHHGASILLISKTDLRRPRREVQLYKLSWNVHLDTGGQNV